MGDVALRLRSANVREKNIRPAEDPVLSKLKPYDKMILCKAVEDRICSKIDLASRDDLTLHQAVEALRLLLRIVRQNDLSIEISSGEELLLACIDH